MHQNHVNIIIGRPRFWGNGLRVATRLPPQTLEGHSARCLLLYLYLSALEPTLDGLGEWLWAATGRIASSSASAAAAAYAGASELPVDFFIARGGAPGKPPVGASRHRFYSYRYRYTTVRVNSYTSRLWSVKGAI